MAAEYGVNRREFLQRAGLAAGAMAVGATARAQQAKRPNVLLYVVDDLGSTDAGCYGNPVIKTPGLDRLAAAGTRFTSAYATTPSCSASRSVILTGMHNHATGQYGHAHSYNHFISFPDIETLPVLLARAGYRTASAGKYHVAPEETYHFLEYIQGGRSPEDMADKCRELIASEEDSPFFLYFCTTEPHRPFVREGSDEFDSDEVLVPPYLPDLPETRQELAKYYGSAQRADRGLVRLLDILEETGHWDDTLVIFVSDNGIAFPGAKTNVYEPGIRLPCVVRDPYQSRRGVVSDAMVNWADLTPTILDFAGAVPEQPKYHGRSFREVLDGEHEGWDEVYASHTFHEITMYYPMRVVRSGKYKLIWNIAHGLPFPFASDLWQSDTWQAVMREGLETYGRRRVEDYLHRAEFELFDLEADPHEVRNLADDPEHAAALAGLKDKLKAFQKRTGDPWVLKWEHE